MKYYKCVKCGQRFTEEYPTVTGVGCKHVTFPIIEEPPSEVPS